MVLRRGKLTEAAVAEVSDIRELKRADLTVLAMPRPAQQLQTLRDTHHRVARAVAAGLRNDEVCVLTGFSLSRVSVLKADPTFMELVAHYRGVITAEYAQCDPVIDYLKGNALKAAAMLSDKLDAAAEKDEFLPTRDLLGIAELGFDRTGYGKVNKNVNINVDFAAQLEAARKRTAAARPQLIEATAAPLAPRSASGDPDVPPASDHRMPPPPFRRL